jgi:hypothetical protein
MFSLCSLQVAFQRRVKIDRLELKTMTVIQLITLPTTRFFAARNRHFGAPGIIRVA